ncbi:hypothetical protein Tco_0816309 [Tanacetum coccineum]
MACSLPHTNSEIEALVQRLINEDKGRQDVLLDLAFQFEDSCAVRDDLRKNLREIFEKDRKLHLSMYGMAAQLQKQIDAKSAWFQEKYFGRTHGGIGCSSSPTNCPLTEKEFHQLRMDEEALKEMLEEEAMNKKAQEEKIRQEQAENDAFFLEFRVVVFVVVVGCYLASVPQEEDHQYIIAILGLIVPLIIVAIGVELGYIVIASLAVLLTSLDGLEFSEFVHDPQHACSRSSSLAVTSSVLSSDVSDAGLPSEKVMASRKNGDDGDLLLFRDGPCASDISVGESILLGMECPMAASCSGELSDSVVASGNVGAYPWVRVHIILDSGHGVNFDVSHNIMADVNAPIEQAPAVAPPTRTDEQILPRIIWVPIGKSNCYIDAEKSQSNPIYKIAVDILKHTNFFRAFTASSTIPAIYIQQFWDTICYDRTDGGYKCQLDEQWFNLTKDTLRDALQITPVNNNKAFSSPPTQDTLINFVNGLGYPKEVKHLSNVVTNDMFQPWRALTTIINLCLTGKTSGFERPRAPVLQILWGVINRAHIDYAERMWEEFTQSIHTFTEDKKNLAQHTQGKKKATLIVIPSVRFTKLIIFHLQRKHKFHPRPESPLHLPTEEPILGYLKFSAKGTKREVFGMPIPNELITDDIQGADYYDAYLKKVAKHQIYLAGEKVSDPDSPAPKPAKSTKPKTTNPKEKKRKSELVDEFVDEGIPLTEPGLGDLEVDTQRAIEESLKDAHGAHRGPLPPVVFRETDTGKFQPLPEVEGKGKEKVGVE